MPSRLRALPFAFACGLACSIAGLTQAQPRFDLATTATVLAKMVLPSHVQLSLDLDPDQDSFGGDVTIRLQVLQTTPAIVLHARQLQAESMQLSGSAGPRALKLTASPLPDTWRLEPTDGSAITPGEYRLQIRYRGQVQPSGQGLFLVKHRVQGQPARMLATQLEAVQARRLLPLFDEPVFRSVFDVQVRAPLGYEVLSNMPLLERVPDGTLVRHRFASTPSMPSYLLAVAVGRFDVLEDRVDGIPLRIFTAPGKREQARFAMAATKQLLPFYASYFGRPYALPKLDQVAVPGTRVGAMEDWGLISYVEDALLFDPERGSPDTQRGVFGLVAHEIAHQWFGNLVSVASWNEIWLNEAFATWMEQKAEAHFHPAWETALRVRRNLDRTFARDATAATRAIRSGPVSEGSVFEVFDGITYDKGGAVLTMIEQWLGPAAFQRGLAAYMTERAMQPATAGDLWHHIGQVAKGPVVAVSAVAASWTDQPGLPLLQVAASCEAGRTVLALQQSRFTLDTPLAGGPWQLPLLLARGDERHALLMTGAAQRLELPGCDARPLIANAGGQGYYRVEYDATLSARLAAAFPGLSPADRLSLLSDSFALVQAGRRPMASHLALLAALPQVADASRAVLMSMALDQWRQLDAAFDGTPAHEPLRAAGRALFAGELARLGWQPAAADDSNTLSLRGALIRRLAALGHAPTLAEARRRFTAALDPAGTVPGSLRGPVLQAVGSDATDAEFDVLRTALLATESQSERWLLVYALAAGRDPARAQRLLGEALSGRLPPDVSTSLPWAVGAVPALVPLAYAFVIDHWAELSKLAGDSAFGGRHWLLPGAASWSTDAGMVARLIADQQRLSGDAGASTAQRTAAEIQVRLRLRARDAAALPAVLAGWAPK